MKYILAFILLSITTEPDDRCTVYAVGKVDVTHLQDRAVIKEMSRKTGVKPTVYEYQKLDSMRVSSDSVQFAMRIMMEVHGAEYTAVNCKE